jgi:DNA polymerase-1
MRKDFLKILENIKQDDDEISNTEGFSKDSRVLIIDGLNLFLRNFAMINYVNQEGSHIGGIGGFLRSLGSLINQIKPTSVYIVFDGIGSSINRKNLIPEYKSNRNITKITNFDTFKNIEEENISKVNQISRLIHYLKCLPVKILSLDKTEADDVIAYLSDKLSKDDNKVFIVSNDKDFLQLINDNITLYTPSNKEYNTPKTVKQKYGLSPNNFIIYKTLLGDASDKVKGIKGLGEKGLLRKFPELGEKDLSLEDIYNISEGKYKEHLVYARVILEYDRLELNYKIMNLKNPLLDDKDKENLEFSIKENPNVLNVKDFITLYNIDGLGNVLKNASFWLRDNFSFLNSFK